MSLTVRCPACGSEDVRIVVSIRMRATDEATGSQGFRCRHCDHRWDPVAIREARGLPPMRRAG